MRALAGLHLAGLTAGPHPAAAGSPPIAPGPVLPSAFPRIFLAFSHRKGGGGHSSSLSFASLQHRGRALPGASHPGSQQLGWAQRAAAGGWGVRGAGVQFQLSEDTCPFRPRGPCSHGSRCLVLIWKTPPILEDPPLLRGVCCCFLRACTFLFPLPSTAEWPACPLPRASPVPGTPQVVIT